MFAFTRAAHKLRKGRQMSAPTEFIFVDTETRNEDGVVDVGKHTLDFGVSIYVKYKSGKSQEIIKTDYLQFETADSFFNWALDKSKGSRTIWWIAHNWNFDAGILSLNTQLESRGYELKKYINGGPPVIIQYTDSMGRSVKIIDSLNYFITSLKGLGESVGIEKLQQPISSDKLEWERYAWRDVEIIQQVIDKFRTFVIEHKLGMMQPTLAGQAYSAFKTSFMKHDIYCHDRESILQIERSSYHGGRTEGFYKGVVEDTLYKLDINSHYPAEMYRRNFPTKIVEVRRDIALRPRDLQERLSMGYSILCVCMVNTSFDAFPFFSDKLMFPTGTFNTELSTPEIEFALEHDLIKSIDMVVTYESKPIFKDYVDYFYSRRLEFKEAGDDAFSYMSKILLNSLYGKFGQRGRRWENYNGDLQGDIICEDITQIPSQTRIVGNLRQILSTNPESFESIPIIASEVTAAGRMTLYRYIIESGFDCYYADTDSLIVGEKGFQNLKHRIGNNLGDLKLEEISEYSEFVAPKHYFFNGKWTIKGIKKNAKNLSDSEYRFSQDTFTSWDVHLRRGEEGWIDIRSTKKTLSGINNKRRGDSGWLAPLEVEEDLEKKLI